jgi:lipopolysaccharide biosynthesis regulator YciM
LKRFRFPNDGSIGPDLNVILGKYLLKRGKIEVAMSLHPALLNSNNLIYDAAV